MSLVRNVFVALALSFIIILLIVILWVILTPQAASTNLTTTNYTAVVLELLPNGSINIVQDATKVFYTQRQFNRIQQKIDNCVKRRQQCEATYTGDNQCPFVAHAVDLKLCLDQSGRILGGRVRNIVLHREDLLQIYEL